MGPVLLAKIAAPQSEEVGELHTAGPSCPPQGVCGGVSSLRSLQELPLCSQPPGVVRGGGYTPMFRVPNGAPNLEFGVLSHRPRDAMVPATLPASPLGPSCPLGQLTSWGSAVPVRLLPLAGGHGEPPGDPDPTVCSLSCGESLVCSSVQSPLTAGVRAVSVQIRG